MSNILGSVANLLGINANQSFRTLPLAPPSICYYTISVRAPGNLSSLVPQLSYTFGLSPSEIRYIPTSLNTIYDVGGPPNTGGVTRQVDLFGATMPIIEIKGTTGYKLHSADAYLFSGLASIAALENIIQQFAVLNQKQLQSNQTQFYTMEIYDYFRNLFFQVVPVGQQTTQQTNNAPQLSYYSLRLAALQKVSSPIPVFLVDLIADTIGTGVLSALSGMNGFLSGIVGAFNVISNVL